jgi:hypothetical protein
LPLTGEGGLLARLTKIVLEGALEGEMDAHLGYARHDPAGRDGGNSRNGKRADLQEQEIGPQRLRAAQPGALRRVPQHRAKVRISVRGHHVLQRAAEPRPQLLQMRHVRADRGISQPGRRPGQHEPGQHASLERRQLIRPGRGTRVTQVPHDRQAQPGSPRLH